MRTSPRGLLLAVPLLCAVVAWGAGEELLTDPGFDLDADGNQLPDGWNTGPEQVNWREIQAFGRDYEIVSKPGAYVLATQPLKLVPGETYTLSLEARGSGGGAVGALLLHGAERPTAEFYLLWRQRVGADYGLYAATFQAPDPVCVLYLYNVTRVGEVAYRRASLIQGTLDQPLVRDLYFGPADTPPAEPLPRPAVAWAKPLAGGTLKTLFTLYSYRNLAEHLALAACADIDADQVYTGPDGQASTCPTALRAQKRLSEHGYDVYVVASRTTDAFTRFIASQLAAGRGVVCVEGFGRSKGLFDPVRLAAVGEEHYLRRDLPWRLMPAELLHSVRAGEVDGGRAVWLDFPLDTTRVWGIEPVANDFHDWEQRRLRYWEYWRAFLARCLAWAARRDADVRVGAAADERGVRVALTGAPAGARLEVKLRAGREEPFGPVYDEQPAVVVQPEGALPYPAGFPGGDGVADVRVLDAAGSVVYWAGVPFERPRRARLVEVPREPQVLRRGDAVGVSGRVEGAGGTLEATLTDAFGRTYARATSASPAVELSLPTRHSLSAGNKLRLRLLGPDGREWDSAWSDVLLPELNRAAWDDFHVTAWGDGTTNPVLSHRYNLLMRELGLNGKFESSASVTLEDGLWPSYSCGAAGFFPGDRDPGHLRRAGCVSDPAFDQRNDERIPQRVGSLKRYGVTAWSLGDEIELAARQDIDEVDFSPASLAAYRAWLRRQYPDLAALNREWGTQYGSFDEAQPALTGDVRGTGNFARFVDFRQFMTEAWTAALAHAAAKVREVDPGVPVGHTNTFGAMPFNGVDYYRLCTVPGFGWGQEYSEAIKTEAQKAVFMLWRSFLPDGWPNLGWVGYNRSEVAARYEPWWLALHGSRGVSYFATNAVDADRGSSWALIHPSLQFTPYSGWVKDSLADLVNGCGKALMHAQEPAAEVAILWSYPSLLASWCESAWEQAEPPDRPPFDSYGAWFRSAYNFRLQCEELGVAYRYVAPEQIAAEPELLSRYRLVCLPYTNACDRRTIAALRGYAEAGGTLVADLDALRCDEHGRPWDADPPLESLFGVRRSAAVTFAPATVACGAASLAGYGAEPLEVLAGEARGRHADGQPAWVARALGGGRTVYLNHMLDPDDTPTREQLSALLAEAGVKPTVTVTRRDLPDRPSQTFVMRRVDGPVELIGVIRDFHRVPETERDPASLRLSIGRAAEVVDMRSGQQLGKLDHLDIALAGGDARLFALLPSRPVRIELTVPATARPGAAVPLAARVVAGGAPGNHVLHVELAPAGQPARVCYRWNVAAKNGVWRDDVPLALNDPPGAWELRVRDVTGGLTASRRLRVVPPG